MPKKLTKKTKDFFVHPTAIVEDKVTIGAGSKIWHFAQVREGSVLGKNCVIGQAVFIDFASKIGDNVKIQNHALIYHQATIEDGVFIGPNVCLTNDKIPRAVNPDGTLKTAADWESSQIKINHGASIGGHSVILPQVEIGKFALIGAGSVVTKDVPDFALVFGNPAKVQDFVCKCGKRLSEVIGVDNNNYIFRCKCGQDIGIARKDYQLRADYRKKKIWLR